MDACQRAEILARVAVCQGKDASKRADDDKNSIPAVLLRALSGCCFCVLKLRLLMLSDRIEYI